MRCGILRGCAGGGSVYNIIKGVILKKEVSNLRQVSVRETEILLELFRGCLELDGDAVEFGCYRGDTSVLFQRELEKFWRENPADESAQAKRLWIYDSFAGLPAKTREDNSVAGDQFKAGELFVSKKDVVGKFKKAGLKIPLIRKGFFEELDPETDVPGVICFGFLDGDLYGSIKTSLRLTAERVSPGGVLVVHDYNNPELPGSARAVDEWLAAHPGIRLRKQETLAILQF